MSVRQVRPVFLVIAGVVALTGLVLPVATRAMAARNEHSAADMLAIAKRMQIPEDVVLEAQPGCTGDAVEVGCWSSRQDPAELATAFEGALSQAAGQPSRSSCQPWRSGRKEMSCMVRFDRAGHYVIVSIDSAGARDAVGTRRNPGSDLRVDAY
ncbi:MAG TPA: hypothetical protein VLL08_24390 [Kineosporiaceae bacterium]|nr:hypothetical protein [Kineosporiaceae bacterium]